jgi:glutaredoxin
METQVLGLSVDSTDCLRAWAESLGGITYPLLSDFYPHGGVGQLFGVLRPDGKSERALFVIDKRGVIRYVDVHDIGEQPDNEVLFGELARIEPELARAWSVKAVAAAKAMAPAPRPEGDVIMYCTSWCPGCKRARIWLKENGIAFTEVDITKDRTAAGRVRGYANGNETTPCFDIKGTVILNFDLPKVEKALGLAK